MNSSVKNKNIPGALVIVVILAAVVWAAYFRESTSYYQVGFNQFIVSLDRGEVTEVILTDQAHIRFRYEIDGPTYITDNPRRATFKEDLLMAGVIVHESGATLTNWQIGIIAAVALGAFILLRRKPAALSKTAGAMALSPTEAVPKYSFADMAGNVEAKESVADIVDFLVNPEKYAQFGARMPRGLILYGMPGTGKTLMAKAMSGEAGVPFYAVSGSDFVQMYVGVGAARVRELFKKARSAGRAVIFIDEIDALGKKRSHSPAGGNDERDQTLNALLTEMSGFSENEGIVVIAATNRLDILDDALLRPGRFDRQVEIAMPDVNARRQILDLHTAKKPVAVDLDKWAKNTVFFSGAMLEGLVNEAAILAAKASRLAENEDSKKDSKENSKEAQITDEDFDRAYYITLAGYEKKDRSNLRAHDRSITAYHEAGHALAAKLVSPENTVAKVSIIPSSKGVGGFCVNIPPERMYYTKKELEHQVIIHMAGRCAEELTFGTENITTGASNDIEKATSVIKRYITQYGMNKEIGILDMRALKNNTVVAQACKKMMDRIYNSTLELLADNQDRLEAIAQALLEKESLEEEDLDGILGIGIKSENDL